MIAERWNKTPTALLVWTLKAESRSAMRLHNHLLRAAHRAVARKKEQALQPAQAIGEALSELNKLPRAAEDQTFDDLLQRLQEAEQKPQNKP
jgi:arginine utilization protein RocB